ncbi:MAG: fatty acid desaturase [Pseudomonadota bacterium]
MPRDDYALATASPALSDPTWYRTDVPRAAIRALMHKDDRIAGRDALLWLGLLVVSGGVASWLWPSLWSLPFWFVYGTLYGSGSDARWHECGHRTAFATPWKNEVLYHIASFMLLRNPYVWRASHVRHHTDTIIVGRDPEIQAMRPPDLFKMFLNIFSLLHGRDQLVRMVLHARGRLHPDEETYVRDQDRPKVYLAARITLAIHLGAVLWAALAASWVPVLLIGLPHFYGAWQRVMTGTLQHLGMAENVTDHRLNTRTVLMNPLHRFLYLNMNYHVEHHMFTMVPYYNLPKLHALLAHDLPAPDRSIGAAYRRLLPVLWRQLRYKDAVIVPDLPPTATPYRPEVEKLRPHAV